MVMELQLECSSWVRVALATFPPINVRARMEDLVGINLGLLPGIPHKYQKKKKKNRRERESREDKGNIEI